MRLVEAVLSIWLVVSVFYWLPVLYPACNELGVNTTKAGFHFKTSPQCPPPAGYDDVYYAAVQAHGSDAHGSGGAMKYAHGGLSEMATLLGQSQEGALKQLLSRDSHGYFAPATLALFTVVYYVCSIFTYGLQIPSGLFVPSMIIGASIGTAPSVSRTIALA